MVPPAPIPPPPSQGGGEAAAGPAEPAREVAAPSAAPAQAELNFATPIPVPVCQAPPAATLLPGSPLAAGFDAAQARLDAAWERYLNSLALTPEQDMMTWVEPLPGRAEGGLGPAFEEALRSFGEALKRNAAMLDPAISGTEDWTVLAGFPPWRRAEDHGLAPLGPLPFRGASSSSAPGLEGAWSDATEPEDPPYPPTPDLI